MEVLFVFLCMLYGCATSEPTDVVYTQYGPVQGSKIPLHTGQIINSFLGIPFAKPPVGELRFQAPEEADPWEDVMETTVLRSACMQGITSFILWITHPGWTDQSEDCLHLNIYTPEDMSGGPYPVMVWMYGGGYQTGANIQYPGFFLAAKDVIVVVPNYRVGNLGFATTGDDLIPGNAGMLDQVQALRFVQENIEAFGGNPDQVTIFGESAGGTSVGLHVVSPMSTNLFHQAILQSGSEGQLWAVNEPAQQPENYIIQSGYFCLGMAPVVEEHFLPEMPMEIRRKGNHNKVPEIIGINKEEGNIFVPIIQPSSLLRGLNRSEFEAVMSSAVDLFAPSFTRDDRWEDVNQALTFFYTDWSQVNDPETNRAMLGDAITDAGFLAASDLQAKSHSEDTATYFYVYANTNEADSPLDWMGAFHGAEIPYVFGFPFLKLNDAARNNSGGQRAGNYTEGDQDFSDYIMTLWTNFAKYGTPTLETSIPPAADEAVLWPTYEAEDYKYMYLDRSNVHAGEKYKQEYVAFFTEYIQWLAFEKEPNAKRLESNAVNFYLTEFLENLGQLLASGSDNF